MSKRTLLLVFILLLPASVAAWSYFVEIFEPRVVYQTREHPLDVVVGDINADQFQDVLTANREGKSISIFMGNGDGTLTEVGAVELDYGATSLALADMNADGSVDIVATLCNVGCTQNFFAIFHGQGDGQFEPGPVFETSGVPYNVAAADFDGDSFQDMAASDYPNQRLIVMLSDGTPETYKEKFLQTGAKTIALEVSDLNGDGLFDLISSDHGVAGSSVYLSEGEGEFSERIVGPTGELPYAIAVDYINQDEVLDLVVAHSTAPGKVSVHFGHGDGSFEFAQEYDVNDRLIFIDTADFNHDGFADLVVTREKQNFAGVFLNDGGEFLEQEEISVPSENHIFSLAVAYMNDDHFPDLVTVDYEANSLSVALGKEPEEADR